MFQSEGLKEYLETSQGIYGRSLILAEWNMNDPEKMEKIGNYFRPFDGEYFVPLTDVYDKDDVAGQYTGGTDSDVEVIGPDDDENDPTIFITKKIQTKLLYSLDDCTKPHRPRSGINYARFLPGTYIDGTHSTVNRPRYYMGKYNSAFRYWSSLRDSGGTLHGLSQFRIDNRYFIDDVAPFVTYSEDIPTNKIVVKMQTNVGTEDMGDIRTSSGTIPDPLFGDDNATTPTSWKVQALFGTTWNTIKNFTSIDTRSNGEPIVGADGYVELTFGIVFPTEFSGIKRNLGTLTSSTNLPYQADEGDYFLVTSGPSDIGVVNIWDSGEWKTFFPSYGWDLNEDENDSSSAITEISDPLYFLESGDKVYREFQNIRGIRIVVDEMNKPECTFDLIEMSPRLVIDVSDRTESYDVKKSLGKIDTTKIPLGSLEPGVGSITLFDYDESFKQGSDSSIIAKSIYGNVSFAFYEVVSDYSVPGQKTEYTVPIKKMYSENKPPKYSDHATVTYELRDLFYLFENTDAPPMLLVDAPLSRIIATMLDWTGFSNYTFKLIDGVSEPTIPYFFVDTTKNVAEVLQQLAVATQSAMFFDEYNNFTVMYKEFLMPVSIEERATDAIISGDSDAPEIIDIASSEKQSLNTGTIDYTERYIQRTTGSLSQQDFVNADQSWIYKPALLWEVAGTEKTRSVNDAVSDQSSYSLGAMPLSSDLTSEVPKVSNGIVINNIIDVGDSVYWLPRFSGYLYSSGEIIRFDAVQYAVQGVGNAWIENNQDYQRFMASLVFNGKMYPTGLVRIFAEPNSRVVDGETVIANGDVRKHGRAQFQTQVSSHSASLSQYWSGEDYVSSFVMKSEYLFDGAPVPSTSNASITNRPDSAKASVRTGLIKNVFREAVYNEASLQTANTPSQPTVQSSALVFKGNPKSVPGFNQRDHMTFLYKSFEEAYRHVGARVRVVGEQVSVADATQSPIGSSPIYEAQVNGAANIIAGGSAGIAIGLNASSKVGYYFEIMALSNTGLDEVVSDNATAPPHNIVFYKVVSDADNNGIPIKLWGKQTDIGVDSGDFAGAQMLTGDTDITVYDLSVESHNGGSSRKFFLYLNGTQIGTVDDPNPLPEYLSAAVFVRGESKALFENFFALATNAAFDKGTEIVADGNVSSAFGVDSVDASDRNRLALSGVVKDSYLSNINPSGDDRFKIWYEEFGAIMREAAYFDILYDRAFPAIAAQISPVFGDERGYTISGFSAGSYGAKFLIFNATDSALNLDETTGNYLRIQGPAFTQNTTAQYTMDDYFSDAGDVTGDNINFVTPLSSYEIQDRYKDVKIRRMKNGVQEFSLSSDYIQTQDGAANLMGWIADKATRVRQQVGIDMFFNPMLQIGDIVSLSYTDNGVPLVADPDTRFLVYNIDFSKDSDGPKTNIFLTEV